MPHLARPVELRIPPDVEIVFFVEISLLLLRNMHGRKENLYDHYSTYLSVSCWRNNFCGDIIIK